MRALEIEARATGYPLRGLRTVEVAGFLALLVVLLSLLALFLPWAAASPERFTPELLEYYQVYDSSSQRMAHRVSLVLVALFSAVAFLLGTRRDTLPLRMPASADAVVTLLRRSGGALLLGALLVLPTVLGPKRYVLVLIGTGVTLLYGFLAERLRRPWAGRLAWAAIGAYSLLLFLPGLLLTPDLSRLTWDVTVAEQHFAMVVGPADRLALGRALYEGAVPYYGVLPTLLLGAWQKHAGLLDFGAHIRLVQVLQVLFFGLALLTYRLWKPGRPFLFLAALVMIGGWLNTSSYPGLHPNQTAWRFLGFPLGVLALLLVRGERLPRAALVLGLASGALLLLNLETAIALSLGYVAFLLARAECFTVRGLSRLLGAYTLGVLGALSLFAVVVALFFRDFISRDAAGVSFSILQRFGVGFGGLPLTLDLVALLIFCHAVYLVLRAAARRAYGALSFAAAFEVAIATVVLVWFAYYMNRPHYSNIWTYLYLYSFLVMGLLDSRIWFVFRRNWRTGFVPYRVTLLGCVVLPLVLLANHSAVDEIGDALRPGEPAGRAMLSGVWLPAETAAGIREKADHLRRLGNDEGRVYFTAHSYLVPLLTGIDNRLPFMDAFTEAASDADFRRLVASTLERAPREVLFDDPQGGFAGSAEQRSFIARVQAGIAAEYRPVEVTNGWHVWQRIPEGGSR